MSTSCINKNNQDNIEKQDSQIESILKLKQKWVNGHLYDHELHRAAGDYKRNSYAFKYALSKENKFNNVDSITSSLKKINLVTQKNYEERINLIDSLIKNNGEHMLAKYEILNLYEVLIHKKNAIYVNQQEVFFAVKKTIKNDFEVTPIVVYSDSTLVYFDSVDNLSGEEFFNKGAKIKLKTNNKTKVKTYNLLKNKWEWKEVKLAP